MPELPEVETTRRGIAPHAVHQRIKQIVVRHHRLRWPVPPTLVQEAKGLRIEACDRRGKYLLLRTAKGTIIIHLDMSGSLRLLEAGTPAGKHDHVDIVLDSGLALRLTDPRRFGSVLWTHDDPLQHELLRDLGPEPLGKTFDGHYLYTASRGRTVNVKQFIMNSKVVVGVGNIYASEALFLARIHPSRKAGSLSKERCNALAGAIHEVLTAAIKQGGTSLRDFVGGDGRPGYFAQQLNVYGRTGEKCYVCGTTIKQIKQGQRSTYYCPHCQR